jgi:hypothetical protein
MRNTSAVRRSAHQTLEKRCRDAMWRIVERRMATHEHQTVMNLMIEQPTYKVTREQRLDVCSEKHESNNSHDFES